MEPKNRIGDLILITERLLEVLSQENTLLKERKHGDLHEILDDKVTLSRIYETKMQVISEKPELLHDADLDIREQLHELGLQVNDLIVENGALLKVAMAANQRVVNLIAEAVKEATPSAGTYGAKGTTASGNSTAESQSASFSLNQVL